MKTKKPRASTPLRAASATKVVRGPVKPVTSVAAESVVRLVDAISETGQRTKPAAQEASAPQPAVREAVDQVTPVSAAPAVRVAYANEPIATTAATIAAAVEELAKPIVPTKTTTPKHLQGMKAMIKSTNDFVALGQANMEAFVKSGQIWAAGVQELTKLFAAATNASFDESVATFTAISSAKSVTEAINLQSAFTSSVIAKSLADSNKLLGASIKLTEQTLAPITACVTGVVDTFKAA